MGRALAAALVTLSISGNHITDGRGHTVHLHGVNRSGTEYACIQGWGMFDGPSDAASVRAIAAWQANLVRVPLNEDCWLGINGVKPAYSGARYRRAIVAYVHRMSAAGLHAELSLIWGAPGRSQATYQPGAPDEDHSPAMWRSLARTFARTPGVILAPWGETIVDARCFLRGGTCEATYGPHDVPYRTAGMQQAVSVMRAAGYRGPIAIPGLDYANDLTAWLSHEPRDPLHQLIAEAHVYGKNTCSTPACLTRTMAPVARRVPLIFAETGQSYDGSSCGASNIASIVGWADAHGAGWAAWTWDTWGNCEALISAYDGAPRAAYGRWVRSHMLGYHAGS